MLKVLAVFSISSVRHENPRVASAARSRFRLQNLEPVPL
jgi:hypothetical protein